MLFNKCIKQKLCFYIEDQLNKTPRDRSRTQKGKHSQGKARDSQLGTDPKQKELDGA